MRQWLPLPFGEFGRLRTDPLGFLLDGRRRYGDVFRFRPAPWCSTWSRTPTTSSTSCSTSQKNYPRSWYYDRTKVVVGEGW